MEMACVQLLKFPQETVRRCPFGLVNLFNEENAVSPDMRILPIIKRSTRSEHIFNDMVIKAQRICINRSELIGAGSRIFIKNPFMVELHMRE